MKEGMKASGSLCRSANIYSALSTGSSMSMIEGVDDMEDMDDLDGMSVGQVSPFQPTDKSASIITY